MIVTNTSSVICYMLSESFFSFAPCTTFATNAFNTRDNYCKLQKNVVTLHLEIGG